MPTAPLCTVADCVADVEGFAALTPTVQADAIAAASGAIAGHCDRQLALGTYAETHRPGRSRTAWLRQYPVTSLSRVATEYRQVLTLQNLGASTSRASCQLVAPNGINPTALALSSVSGGVASAVSTLAFSGLPTIASLAVALNGVAGWSATTPGTWDGWATVDLDAIGQGGPVDAFSGPASMGAYVRDLGGYELDVDTGAIRFDRRRHHRWSDPAENVMAIYSAGFNPDPLAGPVTMPDEVKRATMILCQALLQVTKVGAKTMERVEDYEYNLGPAANRLIDLVKPLLTRYRRRRLA